MMNRIVKNIALFVLLISSIEFGQFYRTEAMGDLRFAIDDVDLKFDPFIMGGNPAYLWISRKTQRLDITQFNLGDYGNYRRKFSSEKNLNIGANVLGIQPLGKSGTFQGKANYLYNKRFNVYRTLKHDTYAGEAFYFADTTTGDVVYNGPLFEFTHSLPLTEKLSIGGTFGYGLLDGLKKVYTYGETVLRNVYGKIGITYAITDKLVVGADYGITNTQERIVASDVNLFTVITYQYRGDTHRVQLSGSKQKYKITKEGNVFGGQLYYLPDEKTKVGLTFDYNLSSTKSIYPVQGMETTDGYSQFENYSALLKAKREISQHLKLAIIMGYRNNFSWSKAVKTDLLIWKWNYSDLRAGLGGSIENVLPNLNFAAEYVISKSAADSSKYIDNRFNNLNSLNHDFRLGGEYRLSSFAIRLGYTILIGEHDFIIGGDDFLFQKITGGIGYSIVKNFGIELFGFYGSVKDSLERNRNYWNISLNFRFYNLN